MPLLCEEIWSVNYKRKPKCSQVPVTTPLLFLLHAGRLWLRVDADKFRAPVQGSGHSLSHWGAELSLLVPSLPRAGVEQCLEEFPTEEQIVPGPARSSRKRKPKGSPGSSLLSSPRRNSAGQRLPTAELPKPLAKAEPSSQGEVEATAFRLCF